MSVADVINVVSTTCRTSIEYLGRGRIEHWKNSVRAIGKNGYSFKPCILALQVFSFVPFWLLESKSNGLAERFCFYFIH